MEASPTMTTVYPTPTWTYSEVLQKSWDGIKANLPFTAALSLVFGLAVAVASYVPFLSYILTVPLSAGYVKCLLTIRRGGIVEYKEFFWGFLDFNRLLQLILLNILLSLGVGIGFLLLIIPGIWFSVASSLAGTMIVLDEQPDAIGVIRRSMAVVKGNWWKYAGLLSVICLVNIAGAMCFLIGLLISMPISVLAIVTVIEAAGADARPITHS